VYVFGVPTGTSGSVRFRFALAAASAIVAPPNKIKGTINGAGISASFSAHPQNS
jgi:hypothetical protein